MIAAAEGRHPRRENVEVDAGRQTPVELRLREGTGVDGRVVTAADGRPIARAVIRYSLTPLRAVGGAKSPRRSPDGFLVTAEDGRFRVPGVSSDSLLLVRADAPGFHHAVAEGSDLPPSGLVLRLEPGGRIQGTVRDRDGRAIANARVHAELQQGSGNRADDEHDVTTRDDGTYVVAGTAIGVAYRVHAEADGYARSEGVDSVVSTVAVREASEDLVLRRPATIVLHVVDDQSRPVEGAWVSWGSGARTLGGCHVDPQGVWRIDGLSPGTFTVDVSSSLYAAASERVEVAEGQSVDVSVTLDPGVRVEGLVLDPDGVPLAEADVTAETVDGHFGQGGSSDSKGRFRLGGLQPGEYVVSAQKDGSLAPPVRVQAPSVDVRLHLRIERLGKVRFRILLPDGSPFAQPFRVSVVHGQGAMRPFRVDEFEEDGSMTLHDLHAGPVLVEADVDGFQPLEIRGVLGAGESKDLGDHTLASGVALVGVVRDTAGRPIAGAHVDAGRVSATTGDDGRFVLAHALPGEGDLVVRADRFLPAKRAVRIAADVPHVEMVLVRYAKLHGLLKDALGKPSPRTSLAAEWVGDPLETEDRKGWTTTSRVDGRVVFRLPPGRWRITARIDDAPRAAIGEWTLAEGEEREVDLVLPAR